MYLKNSTVTNKAGKTNEKGAALAISIIVLAILLVIALTALAFSSTEARIAGSDLQRTQTFYAASTGMEKMTNDFSNLFRKKCNPTACGSLRYRQTIRRPEMKNEGFNFHQTLEVDSRQIKRNCGHAGFAGKCLSARQYSRRSLCRTLCQFVPYKMSSMATMQNTKTEVKLEREFNNYLVPLFQFGIFSNEDIEIHPGPLMTFNGRIHTQRQYLCAAKYEISQSHHDGGRIDSRCRHAAAKPMLSAVTTMFG